MSTITVSVPVPPPGGFTLDDLAQIDTPNNTQLIHGGLYVNAAPASWHNLLEHRLMTVIEAAAPDLVVFPQMAVKLAPNHAPQPDILVVERDAFGPDVNAYPPDKVVLAVEIMSRDKRKDRVVRPEEYARAGIPHYWRIERTATGDIAAYTYELDAVTTGYERTGAHTGRLTLTEPWKIDCDLNALSRP